MLRRLIIFLALALLTSAVAMASRGWEEADRMRGTIIEHSGDTDQETIQTSILDGYVYVSLRQRTAVKIFTILGQPIVQENLAPGIYRFRLTTRGIYLLKIGSITRRITI